MEREAKIVSWEQDFLYTTEKYRQLTEKCLLVIGCHIILRDHLCNVIVLNVHAPSEGKVMIQKTVLMRY